MTENRSYDYVQGQGHLGHMSDMTPHWTRLMIIDADLLKGVWVNLSLKSQYLFESC